VTSHRPSFHWVLEGQDDGAQVDVCRDRACTSVVTSFLAKGTSAAPAQPLTPGVYYWRLHGTEGALTGTHTGPAWELTVPVRDTPVDTSWGTRLDVDGDGLSDLAVSGSSPSVFEQGVAYVYRGTAAGPSTTSATLSNPPQYYDALVHSGGDVNGDGFGELLVGSDGAPGGNGGNTGAVLVYPGGPGWASTAPALLPNTTPRTYEFGAVVQSAGDVNGDGYGDVLISAVTQADHATASLYLGSPSGLSPSPTLLDGGVLFAPTMTSDVNGDGLSDVLVGVVGQMNTNAGELHVYLGTPQGLSTNPTVLHFTANPATQDQFYVLVGDAGDLNGDGFGDIVVGLPMMGSGGSIYVYLGSATGLRATPIVLPGPGPLSLQWGYHVAGGGDVDGDGFDDLVVGTYALPTASAYLFRGGPSGVSTTPDVTLNSPGGANFGTGVVFLGDVDGDGFDDFAVDSSSGGDPIYVFLGGPTGPSATPIAVGPPASDPKFGWSIASLTTPWCTESHG
jgi:hypothetical protein